MMQFKTERWTDFANEAVSKNTKHDMEKHPGQGAEICSRALSVLRPISAIGKADGKHQTRRRALRDLVLGPRETCSSPKVLFDSFLLFEGTRATGAGPRRMLYSADPYQIDLQVETSSDQSTLVITGQVLDSRQSGFLGRDVLVVISNLRGQVVLAMANQFGEFRKEIPDSDNLELFFLGLTDHPFTIAVGHPLRRQSEKKRARDVRDSGTRGKGGEKAQ